MQALSWAYRQPIHSTVAGERSGHNTIVTDGGPDQASSDSGQSGRAGPATVQTHCMATVVD